MNSKKSEYALSFAIPKGEIGSVGPTGPIGPYNQKEPLIHVIYRPSNISGLLTTDSAIFLPVGQTIFRTDNNLIYSDINGQYEFTLSGCLVESTTYQSANLVLRLQVQNQTRYKDIMNIHLNENQDKKYFSYTIIAKSMYTLETSVILNKNINSDAAVQELNLIMRRLPFDYNE